MSKDKSTPVKLEVFVNFKVSDIQKEMLQKHKDRIESRLRNLSTPFLFSLSGISEYRFGDFITKEEKRIRTKKERLKELSKAIISKLKNLEEIPYEWYDEYNDLKSVLDFNE